MAVARNSIFHENERLTVDISSARYIEGGLSEDSLGPFGILRFVMAFITKFPSKAQTRIFIK